MMNLRHHRFLCIEIYKTLISLNPISMKKKFQLKITKRILCEKFKLNLNISRRNKVALEIKNHTFYGKKRFGTPYHMKF